MTNNSKLSVDSSAVQAHLTIMQGVIQRMAENGRSCKVWCVTLVAATLVLVARTEEPRHALVALAPTVLFYLMDAYYLMLERRFRNAYDSFVEGCSRRARIHVKSLHRGTPRLCSEGVPLVHVPILLYTTVLCCGRRHDFAGMATDPIIGARVMASRISKHMVFISFHEQDLKYKEMFVRMMGKRIVDRSVDTGSIDDTGLKTQTVRQKIRDEYIRDATVTIVLIGPRTWQRKHVDWEIGSSIRRTKRNPRCGLLGIVLPSHSNHGKKELDPHFIPPRLADNWAGDDSYALIYDWPRPWAPAMVAEWIHRAYVRRGGASPNNSRGSFARNRTRDHRKGWQ